MIPTQPAVNGEDLFTINAAGYSATADAFARDPTPRASGSCPWWGRRPPSRPSGPPC